MIYLFIRLRTTDYARWKEVFETHLAARQADRVTDQAFVMRNIDDVNKVTVLMSWRDLKTARLFVKSVSLNESIQQAGLIGSPEIQFLQT